VYKNVLTGLALDESESLAGIEPLYCSLFFHLIVSFFCLSYLCVSNALSRKRKGAASCIGLAAPFNKSKGFTRATNAPHYRTDLAGGPESFGEGFTQLGTSSFVPFGIIAV
jgi:hypothetical protein